MDGLDGLQTCEDELLGPPLNADAMGAHHLGGAVKDDCRPDAGLRLGVMDAPNEGRLRLYVGDGDRDYQV